jgi:hypothetical protein
VQVNSRFNEVCIRLLNNAPLLLHKRITKKTKAIESSVGVGYKNHLDALWWAREMIFRLDLEFSPYIEAAVCCFFPGKVILYAFLSSKLIYVNIA